MQSRKPWFRSVIALSLPPLGAFAAAGAAAQSSVDPALAAFIASIKAVDNHAHVNSAAPDDADADALPLDGLPPFEVPARLRPENPEWLAAYKALYGYPWDDLNGSHLDELRATMRDIAKQKGDAFPTWALDRIGTEVMIANRLAMGPGLAAPRFQWASYADALMLPLSTKAEAGRNPDAAVLYPLEQTLLRRYLADLGRDALPSTLDAYLQEVVTPTLEGQRKAGCVAVKFEAAYLRRLDFDAPHVATARSVYAKYVAGGEPGRAEYKALQDVLFRNIAREAGRLGMAVHIHSFEGAGAFYDVAGSDPLLLEPAFNDPALRNTRFVIVHGGGIFAAHAGALLMKPNVFLDFSIMPQMYSARMLAEVLRPWLTLYPEKVLYGSDAFANGPDAGWELSAWLASTTARHALGIALTGMMQDGEITLDRAEAIATLVLRTNAARLYGLSLR
jgi:uncharacterized protein